jgi:hypothetical protein
MITTDHNSKVLDVPYCDDYDNYFLKEFGVYEFRNQLIGPGVQEFRQRVKAVKIKLDLAILRLNNQIKSPMHSDDKSAIRLELKCLEHYTPSLSAMFTSQIVTKQIEDLRQISKTLRLNRNADFHSKPPFSITLPSEIRALIYSYLNDSLNCRSIIDEYFKRAHFAERIYDTKDTRGYIVQQTYFIPQFSCGTFSNHFYCNYQKQEEQSAVAETYLKTERNFDAPRCNINVFYDCFIK